LGPGEVRVGTILGASERRIRVVIHLTFGGGDTLWARRCQGAITGFPSNTDIAVSWSRTGRVYPRNTATIASTALAGTDTGDATTSGLHFLTQDCIKVLKLEKVINQHLQYGDIKCTYTEIFVPVMAVIEFDMHDSLDHVFCIITILIT
jgi:hypothetical protein